MTPYWPSEVVDSHLSAAGAEKNRGSPQGDPDPPTGRITLKAKKKFAFKG